MSVRHYWRTVAVCIAALVAVPVAVGSVRVQPYVSSDPASGSRVTEDIAGLVDLFDETVDHTVELRYDERDYQRMLDAYFADGTKSYIEADLVLDGTTLPSVGIRLKGNSTLRPLTRTGPPGALQAGEPEHLPWLIRFDEYVEGRRYQGHRELALRAGDTRLLLNEALSLDLLAVAGEVAPEFAYPTVRLNDRPATVRLLVEHPDEQYADEIAGRGVLYEASATASFSDQGPDPTAYADDFDQINLEGGRDLQPVIDLIRWVDSSSDAEFQADLHERVDTEALARYLAMQNLLLNYDDMAGPGKNYYLYHDLGSGQFSVIGWDYNLTFGARPDLPPHESAGAGDGHPLKVRFLAQEAFKVLYEETYRGLFERIYRGGTALRRLEALNDRVARLDAHDHEALAADVDHLRGVITQRLDALTAHPVLRAPQS